MSRQSSSRWMPPVPPEPIGANPGSDPCGRNWIGRLRNADEKWRGGILQEICSVRFPTPPSCITYSARRINHLASRFSLINLQKNLPDLVMQAGEFADKAPTGKKVLFFATLHYWIEQAALLGLTLAGLGHECHLAYLPYSDWQKQINRFDLRRQDIYARLTLEKALPYVRPVSLLGYKTNRVLPASLLKEIETVSYYDAQYTLQVETVDLDSEYLPDAPGTQPLCRRKITGLMR